MTIHWGDTGKADVGTLKTFNITLPTPRETLEATPIALPTTSPADPQISYTIQQSDLPTISPRAYDVKYSAFLYIAGKNASGSSQTVTYEVFKNGVSVATSSHASISDNTFWTHTHHRFFDVVVGDVLTVKVWATSTGVNYDYHGLLIVPTQINLGKPSTINKGVVYTISTPTLTKGNPTAQTSSNFLVYPTNLTYSTGISSSGDITFGSLSWNSSYHTGRLNFGDSSLTSTLTTHATLRPYYARPFYPSIISFREVLR